MRTFRNLRVGNLIREELAVLIERELEFPDTLVTLTEVEVGKKLDNARVGVSVIPTTKEDEVLKVLLRVRGELQHLLNRRLNIRPMPQVIFYIDHGLENAARVEKALLEE